MNVAFESARRTRGQTYPLSARVERRFAIARSGRAPQLDRRQVLAPADVADERARACRGRFHRLSALPASANLASDAARSSAQGKTA